MKLRFSVVTVLVLGACQTTSSTPPVEDAAVFPDAAVVRRDASVETVDAGTRDAAVDLDASVEPDAAVEVDASVEPDAAVERDAAIDVDAASPPDAAFEGLDAAVPELPDAAMPVDAGVDLGWAFDASVPAGCSTTLAMGGGNIWSGWANYQYPPVVTVNPGEMSPLLFGQVYAPGQTEADGQAAGWLAELLVGPYGTLPTDGRCWSSVSAAFNVQSGNNDEYKAQYTPSSPGVLALYYRYRPTNGGWRYGDRDGTDNGLQVEQAGLMHVHSSTTPERITAVTMNLRCRLDDWPARKPLLVRALARVNADVMGFQEDCLDPSTGASQADELRSDLSVVTGRGYESRRVTTHTAMNGTESFQEGISVLSALPIESSRILDLPSEVFPRKAIVVETRHLRFYTTHLEFGTTRDALRESQARAILMDAQSATGRVVVTGDLNATPDSAAVRAFSPGFVDVWASANPRSAGLTHPAGTPTRRIDYVFSAGFSRVLGARILDENQAGVYLSDHRGVAGAVVP